MSSMDMECLVALRCRWPQLVYHKSSSDADNEFAYIYIYIYAKGA